MASGLGPNCCATPSQANNNKDPIDQCEYMSLTYKADCNRNSRMPIPLLFMRANGLAHPGEINLASRDGSKTLVRLRQETKGRMCFGKGWKVFVKANEIKLGDSFKLKLVWEETTPILQLVSITPGEYCNDSETTAPASTEPTSGNKNNTVEITHSSTPIQNRLVLEYEDAKDHNIHLPLQFMKANGMTKKRGKVIFRGKITRKEWCGCLTKNGKVILGIGWSRFVEANGVKVGDHFCLEFNYGEDKSTPVFEFSKYIWRRKTNVYFET